MQLFAFVVRKAGTTREQFLHHWHEVHGPLIRDTPGLGDRLLRYEQHPTHPNDRSGYDGVAVQAFATWDDFLAMLDGPAGAAMRADETRFIEQADIKVVFTAEPTVIVSGTDPSGPTA